MSGDPGPPMLRVVHGGTPSDEEVAALAVALAAVTQQGADDEAAPGSHGRGWAAPDSWQSVGRRPGTRTKASW